jgi:hypothetical protein
MGFWDDLTKGIRESLNGQINDLMKADGLTPNADMIPEKPQPDTNDKAIGRQAVIDDPFFDQVQQHFIFKNKMSRISNKTLKDTSMRDWLTSSIIQHRCDTLMQFSRPQRKMFDLGFKIIKKDSVDNLTPEEKAEIANLEDFILNCGRKDKTPPGERMILGEFLKLLTRDALTFGHIAVEKILTRRGALHRIRPIPAESTYLINQQTSRNIIEKEIENARKTKEQRNQYAQNQNDPVKDHEVNEVDHEYYKYVQMSYDNRVLAAFGDEDMVWKLFNPQNFADAMGYCYSPLEMAVVNVTNHLNVENYNANFFTHGYAAKGVLHLKGTVTQAQLTAFRRQFYNTISGAQHAWRTPIIAGLDDVQWVGLAGSAREMEYLNYNNHIMRAVCTQFQIDPIELGLDYLVSGTGKSPSQQANNEYKINYSRERGLYPILMMFEDFYNKDIIPAIDPELAKKYELKFVGYTDETPQTNVALLQAEMSVYSTMNDLLRSAGKEKVDHPMYEVPLNATFWSIVEKNMTRGEIRETFFGDKDASKRRELAYIPSDPAFMGWQQLIMTMDRTKRQDQLQAEQMKAEQEQAEQQGAREQEQHDMSMEQEKARQAHGAVSGHESLKDIAKESGAASSSLNIDGQSVGNPINSEEADE